MYKYLIKYSYIPDYGVPMIKTDYIIIGAISAEKAKQIFIASFPNFKILNIYLEVKSNEKIHDGIRKRPNCMS